MEHVADRLIEAIQSRKTPLCVGLDPRWESLPAEIRQRHGSTELGRGRAYEEFGARLIDVVAPIAGVLKPQSAFFEAIGPAGLEALRTILARARQRGLFTVLDAKRNDIASTAEAYAEMAFSFYNADGLTVNPYLGRDSIEPFLKVGRRRGRGLFVLVRTSNPGAGQFQDLLCQGQPLHVHVARAVEAWSRENLGKHGFGDVGAVVGATNPAELSALRQVMPSAYFLVPGYGAQGGTAEDVKGGFRADGLGAIVNSARAINFPFPPDAANWESQVEAAARKAASELGQLAFG
jgi:orotidine-5'-phosphate decarboxylase